MGRWVRCYLACDRLDVDLVRYSLGVSEAVVSLLCGSWAEGRQHSCFLPPREQRVPCWDTFSHTI
jgi:hypothetical protein